MCMNSSLIVIILLFEYYAYLVSFFRNIFFGNNTQYYGTIAILSFTKRSSNSWTYI